MAEFVRYIIDRNKLRESTDTILKDLMNEIDSSREERDVKRYNLACELVGKMLRRYKHIRDEKTSEEYRKGLEILAQDTRKQASKDLLEGVRAIKDKFLKARKEDYPGWED